MACYAPDGIPRQIIGGGEAGPGEDEALGLLASYGMITLTADAVSMHKLVQAVILAGPDDSGNAQQPRDTALEWLYDALPGKVATNVAAWPFLRVLIPQAEAVASRYATEEAPIALGLVLGSIGQFHQSQGTYQDALRLRKASLGIAQSIHGDSHPETANCLGNLATTYSALGRYAEALPLQERALAVAEAALGPDHPDTARCLNNLAASYRALDRAADAEDLEQRPPYHV
jgi:tetratricopeptide (TPR) repeat protein